MLTEVLLLFPEVMLGYMAQPGCPSHRSSVPGSYLRCLMCPQKQELGPNEGSERDWFPQKKRQLPISAALNALHSMKNSTCKRAYTKSLHSYTNHPCRVGRKLRKLLVKDVKVPITLLTPYLKPSAQRCEAFHTHMKAMFWLSISSAHVSSCPSSLSPSGEQEAVENALVENKLLTLGLS